MRTERESMLQLAAQAFQSKNFDLAAEIYECQLTGLGDPGSRQELMVKRADALAFGGKFTEAFDAYRQASEIERLRPAHLANLIEYLSSSIRRQDAGDSQSSSPRTGEESGAVEAASCTAADATGCGYADISCRICLSFLFEPVTLPCGHCYCLKCLERERKEKERPLVCKECSFRVTDDHSHRVNVVLSSLLAKWFPTMHQAGRLRREGNGLYTEKKMEAALEKYNQAILIAPMDHILFSNRSQIHSSLKHYGKALRDADMACRLKPHWSKALVTLGRTEEALREYLVCLSIEPDCRLAKTEAHKLLSHLLAPVTDQVPEHISDYSNILSSRAQIKNSISAPFQTLTPSSCHQSPVLPPLLLDVRGQRAVRLFYEPVTTPCGHTFCLQCLERCLDHNPKCPLCKEELSEYLVQRQYCKTVLMENLISKYLSPESWKDRKSTRRRWLSSPKCAYIVCTMAFPTVPCPLHIFEPCYRLMIRRCMETGTNCFGMCLGDNLKGFADYGCLLEIRDVKFFSDGRSVVDTIADGDLKSLSTERGTDTIQLI
ncbi:hypothetical protein INR49_028491 [Caranx melampygus]|nr:hypothetical protein INR49_028491 [Caranx melampygus]